MQNHFWYRLWLLLCLAFFSEITWSQFNDSQLNVHRYIGTWMPSAQKTEHFYLTDNFEEHRRVFRMFHSVNNELQDLLWVKSFPADQSGVASEITTKWLQEIINQYHLKSSTEGLDSEVKAGDSNGSKGIDGGGIEGARREGARSAGTVIKGAAINSAGINDVISDEQPGFGAKGTIGATGANEGGLWQAENEWSAAWEAEYGRWVGQVLTPHFMEDIKLRTDCADVAYTLRWVFARINKLPMAVHLGGSNQLFTNETISKDWQALPQDLDWKKDRRFRAALEYLLRNTYTHTLMGDSYPVAINTTYLTPGTYHLSLFGETGHTMLVNSVNDPENMPITLLFSTTPVQVRELIATFYQNEETPKLYQQGFYKIRWAKKDAKGWQLIPAKIIPGYSEEQFNLPADPGDSSTPHFLKIYKLINPNFSFDLMLEKSHFEIGERIKDRIELVEQGFAFCKAHDCAPGSAGEEDWSTPSRDKRLLQLLNSMNLAARFLSITDQKAYKLWKTKLAANAETKSFVIDGEAYSLAQIVAAFTHKLTQTDPRVSVGERWGVSLAGLSSNLVEAMRTTLEKRKVAITGAEECRKNKCHSDSADYVKFNTIELDNDILTKWLGGQRLCEMAGGNQCAELKENLSKITIDQNNLNKWFEQSPFWLSNPSLSAKARWGYKGKSLPAADIGQVFATKDEQWFTQSGKLYRAADLSQVAIDSSEILGQLHFINSNYFTYQKSEKNLIVRFYKVPNKFISEIKLPVAGTDLRRIWWSSKAKESLSIFTLDRFFEVSLQGEIIQELKYSEFAEVKADHVLSMVQTANGVMLSDAKKDASHFFASPLSFKEINSFANLITTDKGILLSQISGEHVKNRAVYIEDSKVILDWALRVNDYVFINRNATIVIKKERSVSSINIYRRTKDSKASEAFVLQKSIPGRYFSVTGPYLAVFTEAEEDHIYALETLETVNFKCGEAGARVSLLSEEYYLCDGKTKREMRNMSGQVVNTDIQQHGFWSIFGQGNQKWIGKTYWLESSGLGTTEMYSINNGTLIGPVLQGAFGFNFNEYIDENENENSEILVAPALLYGLRTNYGLINSIHSPSSFLLNSVLRIPDAKDILFLPDLEVEK